MAKKKRSLLPQVRRSAWTGKKKLVFPFAKENTLQAKLKAALPGGTNKSTKKRTGSAAQTVGKKVRRWKRGIKAYQLFSKHKDKLVGCVSLAHKAITWK